MTTAKELLIGFLFALAILVPLGYELGGYLQKQPNWQPMLGWFLPAEKSDAAFAGMLLAFVAADFARYLVTAWAMRRQGVYVLRYDLGLSLVIAVSSRTSSPATYLRTVE